MTYKISFVEDDDTLRENLKNFMESKGYRFQGFRSSEDFMWASSPEKCDLLVVDRNLPGQDGIELVKKIRENNKELPIILLTSRTTEQEVVAGLEVGANDYVTKPFSTTILLAKIRSRLPPLVVHKDIHEPKSQEWQINDKTREIIVGNDSYMLSAKEFQIFKELSNKRGDVATREELLSLDKNISSRNVDVHIVALRKKLDPSGILIQTIRGVGYRLKKA